MLTLHHVAIATKEFEKYVELFENHIKPHRPTTHYIGLPMQYIGLNYIVDYTGSILLGVGIKEGSRNERYHQVFQLDFEDGILMQSTNITETWSKVHNKATGTSEDYWWQKKENDYYYLINYGLMGIP